jgi:hypothetical protein
MNQLYVLLDTGEITEKLIVHVPPGLIRSGLFENEEKVGGGTGFSKGGAAPNVSQPINVKNK